MWKEKLQLSSQKRAKNHRFSNARKLALSIISGLEDKLLFAPFRLASFLVCFFSIDPQLLNKV